MGSGHHGTAVEGLCNGKFMFPRNVRVTKAVSAPG